MLYGSNTITNQPIQATSPGSKANCCSREVALAMLPILYLLSEHSQVNANHLFSTGLFQLQVLHLQGV
jgi:hypothetical protein